MSKITFFDGVRTIGGSKFLLSSDESQIFLDFGKNFKKEMTFYEEYLKPRSTRGIYDYFSLGLLPPLDIYREDLIPNGFDRTKLKGIDLDGVLISHAHMDHAGYVGLVKEDTPIFSSPMSAAILKVIQDAGRSSILQEIAYVKEREGAGKRGRVLKPKNWRKSPTSGRDFFLSSAPSKELLDFWKSTPGGRDHEPGMLKECTQSDEPMPFESFEVAHSIFGSTAYCVEVGSEWVVYTGDLRFHGKNGDKTEKFVKAASKFGPKILVTEGTRTGKEEVKRRSERTVYENCLEAIEGESGLVIADFSPRDFERLETFLRIAEKTGRELVVTSRDAYGLDSLERVDGRDRTSDIKIYKDFTVWKMRRRWERQILEKFEENIVDPQDVADNADSYILCFSFWGINNLLDIKPEGGKYIYSTSEAFTEEQELDVERLWEWLRFFDLEPVGFDLTRENGETRLEFESEYHCSGHATPKELIDMIEKIDPEIVIPVHTENPTFFEETIEDREVRIVTPGEEVQI